MWRGYDDFAFLRWVALAHVCSCVQLNFLDAGVCFFAKVERGFVADFTGQAEPWLFSFLFLWCKDISQDHQTVTGFLHVCFVRFECEVPLELPTGSGQGGFLRVLCRQDQYMYKSSLDRRLQIDYRVPT